MKIKMRNFLFTIINLKKVDFVYLERRVKGRYESNVVRISLNVIIWVA